MKYATVCSGIEAPSVAWDSLGWQPVFFSEIDKFPSAVLKHHYPTVPNMGDMTNYKEWPDAAIDVICGGTPCQSFSVAGLRKGLDDPRGNLAITYIGIIEKFKPKWVIWENVPGVLSSNGGRDFGAFIEALGQLGYGFAYRVLDAQYFGVAQRRRRVFVVGCFGDWRGAAAVLFEPESLCGDNPQGKKQLKKATRAHDVITCSGKHTFGTLLATCGTKQWLGNQEAFSGDYHVFCKTTGRVRKVTPTECERLQGFPDNYTNIPTASDTPRYKALGNSMAVPVMRWIGQRIDTFNNIEKDKL